MPFNLLILPLLGGYVFLRCWNYSKFYIIRADKERLLIAASLAGVGLLAVTYLSHILLAYRFPCSESGFCAPTLWNQWIPIPYSGVSFATFVLGIVAPHVLNLFFDEDKQIDRVIERDAEPLELLLRRAQVEQTPVSITLDSGKVYIGRVSHQFNPGTITNNISLMPLKSGYRDPDTQTLTLKLDYRKTYENIRTDADKVINKVIALRGSDPIKERELVEEWIKLQNISNRFELVLPVSQIVSANLFDSKLHDKYFKIEKIPDDPPSATPKTASK